MSEIKQVRAPETSRGRENEGAVDSTAELHPERAGRPRQEVKEERPQSEEIRLDVIFDILKNQRRRHVLRFLKENQSTTLSDLAEHVAALENDKDVQSLTSSERKRVYVGLYQCHLPRMNDAGVIDFDSDRGRIELNEAAEYLEPYLAAGADPHRPWPLYHLGLALGGGVVYGLFTLAFGPAALASVLVLPLLILTLAATSLIQYRESVDDEAQR